MFRASRTTSSGASNIDGRLPDTIINDEFTLFDYLNAVDDDVVLEEPSSQHKHHILSGNEMFTDPCCVEYRHPESPRSYCEPLSIQEPHQSTVKLDSEVLLSSVPWLQSLANDSKFFPDTFPPPISTPFPALSATSPRVERSSIGGDVTPPFFGDQCEGAAAGDVSCSGGPSKRRIVEPSWSVRTERIGTGSITPSDSGSVTNLWENTYRNRSESIVSLDSGHWSLASSPERRYGGSTWDRSTNQYLEKRGVSAASHGDTTSPASSSSHQSRTSRSDVATSSSAGTGAVRHKRSSHIRAEKKRKAKIESELASLKKMVDSAGDNGVDQAGAFSTAAVTASATGGEQRISRAGQLKAAADKLRDMNFQLSEVDYEIENLYEEKQQNLQILKSMWESMDIKNKPQVPEPSLADRMEAYHREKLKQFGLSYEIFQEFISPAVALVTKKLSAQDSAPVLNESLVASVSDEGLLTNLRQSCMLAHTKLLQRFESS